MDMGDMKSKEIGDLVSRGLVNMGKELLEEEYQENMQGQVPDTIKNQNLGHNSKKEGLGPNTKK